MESIWKVGDRAGIKWIAATCGICEFCLSDGPDEVHCLKQTNSGFTAEGTFQEYVVADGRYTSRIPEGVLDEEAGPIMCGGVTAVGTSSPVTTPTGRFLCLFARQSIRQCLPLCLANAVTANRNLRMAISPVPRFLHSFSFLPSIKSIIFCSPVSTGYERSFTKLLKRKLGLLPI